MSMKIKCFGVVRDITSESELIIEDRLSNVAELKNYLKTQFPEFKNIGSCMIAVNQSYADDTTTIDENDELAIIPPVAGG